MLKLQAKRAAIWADEQHWTVHCVRSSELSTFHLHLCIAYQCIRGWQHLQKLSPKCNFTYNFLLFLIRCGAPPMTLTDTQLPAAASNVCTTDAWLGGDGPNKNPGYAGGVDAWCQYIAFKYSKGPRAKTCKEEGVLVLVHVLLILQWAYGGLTVGTALFTISMTLHGLDRASWWTCFCGGSRMWMSSLIDDDGLELHPLSRPQVEACVPAFLFIAATGRRKHTQVDLLWITRRFRTIAAFPVNSERLNASVFTSTLPATKR